MKRALITGCVRDCAPHLPALFRNIEALRCLFDFSESLQMEIGRSENLASMFEFSKRLLDLLQERVLAYELGDGEAGVDLDLDCLKGAGGFTIVTQQAVDDGEYALSYNFSECSDEEYALFEDINAYNKPQYFLNFLL